MDQWFARTHAGGTDAVLTDLLGSPVGLGGADGSVSARWSFDPFGVASVSGDVHGADLGFTGRQLDGAGLTFHRARYYDAGLGRFISEDPIGFAGGSNLYAYGANAPTVFTDPTGRNPMLIGCVAGRRSMVGRRTWVSGCRGGRSTGGPSAAPPLLAVLSARWVGCSLVASPPPAAYPRPALGWAHKAGLPPRFTWSKRTLRSR
ncbi:RHS repeat-associated core domain-containing protein [Cellulomonas sp. zg-ZUI40]|nr:RHS repeat-associated core domain-containing protein [Cellulomonas dongxiuzhuiae]